MTIVCTVKDGDEPIRISWSKDNAPLSVDLGIDFMEAKKFSYLQIREIKKEHSGNYSCTAKNSAGESKKTVSLSVLGKYNYEFILERMFEVIGLNYLRL